MIITGTVAMWMNFGLLLPPLGLVLASDPIQFPVDNFYAAANPNPVGGIYLSL